MSKKGFKVKRSRHNVYRRKSKARKVFETVLFVLFLAALVYVGYLVAPSVINFFSGANNSSVESSAPTESSSIQTEKESSDETLSSDEQSSSEPEKTTTTTTSTVEKPPAPAEKNSTSVFADTSVLSDKGTLEAFVADAKKQGYDSVVFELKNYIGEIFYKSSLELIPENSGIVRGKLTAAEIVKTCEKAGVKPGALITTLYDRLAPRSVFGTGYYLVGTQYWHWLDARSEDGGKPWVSPCRAETTAYFEGIIGELCASGFETVILKDVKFPNFTDYDYTLIDAEYASSDRSVKLAEFVTACAKKAESLNRRCVLQLEAEDVLCMAASGYDGTAEILKAKDKLGKIQISVNISASVIGKKLETGPDKVIEINSDPAKAVKQILENIAPTFPLDSITVDIAKGEYTDEVLSAMIEQARKLGLKDVIVS